MAGAPAGFIYFTLPKNEDNSALALIKFSEVAKLQSKVFVVPVRVRVVQS